MTSLKDIQSLIADIDRIFPKADAHLPWSKPGDVALQRRVLERVRRYLVAQQENITEAANPSLPQPSDRQESVQQIVQAVVREMDVLRADLMQPLQADLEALRQQRESVVREIRTLEQKKQQMISEFSQELLNRCTHSLTQQLAQIVANFEASIATGEWTADSMDAHSSWPALEGYTDAIASVPSHQDGVGADMHSQQQAEQLRSLQEQSDRMWATLDANQRTIFETLQRNLISYQDSLSQGLEKMHSLGVQGELLFTTFVNRWIEQLGQNPSASFSSASQPEAGTSQATPATLLPNDTATTINPNTLSHFPEQTSTGVDLSYPLSTAQPEALPTIISPQVSQISTPNLPSSPEVRPDTSGSSSEESLLEDWNSADWEIVEGSDSDTLDFDLGDNDAIDTFIQLDLNDTSLRESPQDFFGDSVVPTPAPGEISTPSHSDGQDLDFLLSWSDEPRPNASDSTVNTPTQAGEATGLNNAEVTDNPTVNTDRRYQEIDDFYQSLFGTEALSDTPTPEHSDSPVEVESDVSEPMQASEEFQPLGEEQPANTEAVPPLSPQVENVLFEGFAATELIPSEHRATEEVISEQASGLSVEHPGVSWEVVLFEDSVPPASNPTQLDQEAQLSLSQGGSLSDQAIAQEQESIEAIAALTDLFEEMGLSSPPSTSEEHSIPALTQQPSETSPTNSEPEASWVDDPYICASPDEDLLSLAALESELEEEIRLNQNTLQQLQQDLNSFENLKNQNPNAQWQDEQNLSSSPLPQPNLAPYTPPLDWHNPQYPPMPPQESLAEDWEEFILNSLRAQQHLSDASATTTAESVESDFDPDLFPQEALELDREHTVNAGTSTPDTHQEVPHDDRQDENENSVTSEALGASELAPSGELVEFEDENFVEMQWDEPTDNTSTEEITQPHESSPFAFPELEFELDFFSPEAMDSELEGEVSAAASETLSSQGQENLSESPQNTTLPLESSENNADTAPTQADKDTGTSEHQKIINPDSSSETEP